MFFSSLFCLLYFTWSCWEISLSTHPPGNTNSHQNLSFITSLFDHQWNYLKIPVDHLIEEVPDHNCTEKCFRNIYITSAMRFSSCKSTSLHSEKVPRNLSLLTNFYYWNVVSTVAFSVIHTLTHLLFQCLFIELLILFWFILYIVGLQVFSLPLILPKTLENTHMHLSKNSKPNSTFWISASLQVV